MVVDRTAGPFIFGQNACLNFTLFQSRMGRCLKKYYLFVRVFFHVYICIYRKFPMCFAAVFFSLQVDFVRYICRYILMQVFVR